MRRCGLAIALLLASCDEDAAPSIRIPGNAGSPPTTTPERDAGTTTSTSSDPNPIALALNAEEACAAVAVRAQPLEAWCWSLATPEGFRHHALPIDDVVGHGDWFLGRTRSATYAWGKGVDAGADAGAGSVEILFGPVKRPYRAGRAAAGARHGCVIDDNEGLHCWGDDAACQTSGEESCAGGRREMTDLSNLLGGGVRFTGVAAGAAHTCAVASTGTGATANVYCWGANANGETGQPAAARTPPRPLPLVPPVRSNELVVAAGAHHGCAAVAGDLYCWGKNDRRQASIASTAPDVAPAKVDLSAVVGKVTALALGGDRTCFVVSPRTGKQPSRAFCLGGDRIVQVPELEDVQGIASSSSHVCAIARLRDRAGPPQLFCWTGEGAPELVALPYPR
ncbi:MAG: hypothetical protein KIT84_07345 [Labilithrix sp.]|nr:hypothetical protein [Labilithrix sp.]MCW5810810.1 hypothetical protein [Labilithrix sp.]